MGNLIVAIQNEYNMSGFKIRMLTRIDMGIAISLMILYTLWLFELPRDWEPNLTRQGKLEPREFRIFCFFIYIVALLINGFQFFTSFLLYGTVIEGTKDREDILSTAEYYVGLLFTINVISVLKFWLLLFYLEYSKIFTILAVFPEMTFHTVEIVLLLLFVSNLKRGNGANSGSVEEGGDDDDDHHVIQGLNTCTIKEVEVFSHNICNT